MRFIVLVALFLACLPALASGFGPWTFGMSADEIRAIESHVPYREFSNGDLETYNADFGGKKQNVQFYLKSDRLWRVAVRTYEGTDLEQAAQAWAGTYTTLKALHGPMETPGLVGSSLSELTESAKALVGGGGKAQMAPVSQPAGEFVFSSFNGIDHDGTTFYMVTVNYDQTPP
jgi:hypothetical protein